MLITIREKQRIMELERLRLEVVNLKVENERLRSHTWEQERAAVLEWLTHFLDRVGVDERITPWEFVETLSQGIERGEHWPKGGTP